ncbi:MAG TPA: ABC transporter permease [Dongiaceae bacterium]|jgi:peptide/nickel transport system permease protein|nr:ABC transporter permease [Dongiaceae bacterium]
MTFLALTMQNVTRPRWTLVVGSVSLLVMVLIAIVPQVFAPFDPIVMDYTAIMQSPSAAHWFGTDNFGRDMFSRVIWATRVDMQIAIVSTLFPIVFGTIVGILTGYYGGWLDAIFGRIVDLTVTFPFFVIVIAIVAVLGPGLLNMYIAIAVINWVFYARLIRAEIRVQKQTDYAAAARVLGYSERRLVLRHLLPNAITPVLVYWVTDMALSILLGSSLGYLGLGAQPPTAEWGVLIADGKNFMNTGWWMSVFPGIAIVIAGVSFSMFGDGLADLFRKRR